MIGHAEAGDVAAGDFEDVVEVDGSGYETEGEAEGADGDGFHPDGVADLVAEGADGAEDAELAAAVGNGDGEGVDDA